jgi:hypothetical protein
MLKTLFNAILLITLSAFLFSFDLPSGWLKAGDKPQSYEMGIAKGGGQDGKNAATIKSIDRKIKGFGTLMQESKPDKYLGKRVRMTAYIKSEKISGWAGLWFRVDQAGSSRPLAFDNMQDRAIKGTTGWTKYEIVLVVPENASLLAYGALLSGKGQIWFSNVTFEIVDDTVKTTGSLKGEKAVLQNEPSNLNFEN